MDEKICTYCGRTGHRASHCPLPRTAPPPSYSQLAERISLLMTFGNATISEHQQNVLAAALKVLKVEVPTHA